MELNAPAGRIDSIFKMIRSRAPKDFFDAHIFSLPRLLSLFNEKKGITLEKDIVARELVDTFPIFVGIISATEDRWYTGKIKNQDYPFDIFLAPERLLEFKNKRALIYSACYIQTKRLFLYPPRVLSNNEWINHLQVSLNRHCHSVSLGMNGTFHFYNTIQTNEPMNDSKVESLFKTLTFPKNERIDGITISFLAINQLTKRESVKTWCIYPHVSFLGLLSEDLEKAKRIYEKPPQEHVRYNVRMD